MQTITFRMNEQGPTVQHRELYSISYGYWEYPQETIFKTIMEKHIKIECIYVYNSVTLLCSSDWQNNVNQLCFNFKKMTSCIWTLVLDWLSKSLCVYTDPMPSGSPRFRGVGTEHSFIYTHVHLWLHNKNASFRTKLAGLPRWLSLQESAC